MATKFVSALTGPEMDQALIDMAYHNSEAYAVGTRNGVAVGSSDVTYHNNAKYYAEQTGADAQAAEAAAARAEAAVPSGTAGAVFFDRAQTLTTAQQEQARANIMAGGSNPNLLDNAYFVGGGSQLGDGVFPINQRGQTSYGTSMYTVDRWRTWADIAVGVTASGLSLTSTNSGGGLFQYPQQSRVVNAIGQQMTFSVELNGTIYSATGQVYLGAWIPIDIPITGVSAIFVVPNNYPSELISVSVRMDGAISTPVLFTRAKLELGTVSTLANDVPPDFGEELQKCQRYFVRFFPKVNSRAYIGTGSANNSNNMLIFVPTPVTLRTTPTVSFSMCNCYNWVAGGSIGLNAINLDSWSDNGVFVSCVPADTSQAPQGEPYALRVVSGGFFDLSCEL